MGQAPIPTSSRPSCPQGRRAGTVQKRITHILPARSLDRRRYKRPHTTTPCNIELAQRIELGYVLWLLRVALNHPQWVSARLIDKTTHPYQQLAKKAASPTSMQGNTDPAFHNDLQKR